jgi:hypothetical protein
MIAVRDLLRTGGDLSGTVVLSVALKQISPAMPSTGIPHDAGLIYQLLTIVIVGTKSYFT